MTFLHQVPRQPAAAGADVERHVAAARERGDELGRDWLDAREVVPTLGLEVVDERPEQRPQDPLVGLASRHARQLALAHGRGEPGDVADVEVAPSGRSRRDCFLVLHRPDHTRARP